MRSSNIRELSGHYRDDWGHPEWGNNDRSKPVLSGVQSGKTGLADWGMKRGTW